MNSVKVCKHEIRIDPNYFLNSMPVNVDALKLMAIRVIHNIFGKKKVIPLWYIKMFLRASQTFSLHIPVRKTPQKWVPEEFQEEFKCDSSPFSYVMPYCHDPIKSFPNFSFWITGVTPTCITLLKLWIVSCWLLKLKWSVSMNVGFKRWDHSQFSSRQFSMSYLVWYSR